MMNMRRCVLCGKRRKSSHERNPKRWCKTVRFIAEAFEANEKFRAEYRATKKESDDNFRVKP